MWAVIRLVLRGILLAFQAPTATPILVSTLLIYDPDFTYTFPGPPIANFISTNENGTISGNITTPSTTVLTTSYPSPFSKMCSRDTTENRPSFLFLVF